jgi:glycosyltransferase involved in cell wall biosynthesis
LVKAVLSALNQTWKNIQVVVCDDASGDETADLIRGLQKDDSRLKYYCHPKNIGMLANYAFALSNIETPLYSFLSDDDILLPCFCEEAINAFKQHPNIAFFASSTLIACKQRGVLRVPLDLWPREGVYMPEESVSFMVNRYPLPTTVMFQKTAEIDIQNQVAWDWDYLLQLASQHPFCLSKKICGLMRSHKASFTSYQSYDVTRNSIQRLIERMKTVLPDKLRSSTLEAMEDHLNEVLFYSVLNSLSLGRKKEAWATAGSMKSPYLSLSVTFACILLPPLRFLLSLLRIAKQRWRKHSFQNYNSYLQYL